MTHPTHSRLDEPNLQWAVRTSLIACIALGALRGVSQLALGASSTEVITQILPINLPITLFWAPASVMIAWVWRRTQSRRRVVSLAWRLAAAAAAVVAEPAWVGAVMIGRGPAVSYALRFSNRVEPNLVFCVAIYSILWAASIHGRDARARLGLARNESAAAEAELHVLTMQLQPHFLFNTLNLISQLVYDDIAGALRTLAHLKELLARSLRHASKTGGGVSLRDELRITSAFLDIQHERFHERLRIALSAAEDVLDAAVPPLILQPLVENAIRHGIGSREAGGSVEVVASRTGQRVSLRVIDDGDGVQASESRHGLGLVNTRLRLEQFFGGDFALDLSSHASNGTTVELSFPFRPYQGGGSADAESNGGRQYRTATTVTDAAVAPLASVLRQVPWLVRLSVVWLIVAVLWTQLDAFQASGASKSVRWLPLFVNNFVNALAWAVVTPIPIFAAQRVVNLSGNIVRRFGEQAGLACAAVAAHVTLWALLLHATDAVEYERVRTWVASTLTLEASVYLTMLMVCVASALALRRQETNVALVQSETRLKRARIGALRVHLQPSVLFGGLDAIARCARRSPRACEFAISRMADLLRDLLANADRESVSLNDEMRALSAYADVMGWRSPVELIFRGGESFRAAVPALLLTALAAASHSELVSVMVARDAGEKTNEECLIVWMTARRDSISASAVDHMEMSLITESLQALFGNRYRLESRATPAESQTRLQLPYLEFEGDEDDDSPATSPVRYSVA